MLIVFLHSYFYGQHGEKETKISNLKTAIKLYSKKILPKKSFSQLYIKNGKTFIDKAGGAIAFDIDEQGNIFVAVSFRYLANKSFFNGNFDNREKTDIAYQDNNFTKNYDYLNYIINKLSHGKNKERFLKNGTTVDDFIRRKEHIIKISPTGKPVLIYAGFNGILDGPTAGILRIDNKILVASTPAIWELTYNGKKAKKAKVLQDGFGIHIGWLGHDLHGLIYAPDGRVYFTNADKGSVFTTKEGKKINIPHRGGVFRMDPDGSNLELYAVGLRNPQELAFDNYGNLFTGDNNGDSGDKARLVHILEGSDSGWHMTYQSLSKKYAWIEEKAWQHNKDGKSFKYAANILPPTGYFGWGPSGLAYYPGVGLGEKYKNTIFLANFPKEITTAKLEKVGASFKIKKTELFIRGQNYSDITFGFDSKLYGLIWGHGWGRNTNGNIEVYEAVNISLKERKIIKQVDSIMKKGLSKATAEELGSYLGHIHKKLRTASLHHLVKRKKIKIFYDIIKKIRASN